MWRVVILAIAAAAVHVGAAMPLGVRLAAWTVFSPDMVTVEVVGGERLAVPAEWLSEWPEIISSAGGDRAAALKSTAANGRTVAECYALGLDPTVATNDFRIVSFSMEDGEVKVECEPKQNRWTGKPLDVRLKGAATLDGPWEPVDVTKVVEAEYKFFKAEVVLP